MDLIKYYRIAQVNNRIDLANRRQNLPAVAAIQGYAPVQQFDALAHGPASHTISALDRMRLARSQRRSLTTRCQWYGDRSDRLSS